MRRLLNMRVKCLLTSAFFNPDSKHQLVARPLCREDFAPSVLEQWQTDW